MTTLRIRKDLLDAEVSVPVGSTHYSGSDALPARSNPKDDNDTEVFYEGQWQAVENIDWE